MDLPRTHELLGRWAAKGDLSLDEWDEIEEMAARGVQRSVDILGVERSQQILREVEDDAG